MTVAAPASAALTWRNEILVGDALSVLRTLPDGIAHSCVTSPPYFGLRDYGHAAQIGLERTPEEYVARLVEVFREVRRVLRDDGTLWLNLGDAYAGGGCGARNETRWPKQSRNDHQPRHAKKGTGLKPKDLIGIPWRVAFALQADGWWLRSDIVWAKRNCMPESVTDRPTKAHEYVFLLAKSESYFYDAHAIREAAQPQSAERYGYRFWGSKSEALAEANIDGVGQRTRPIGERESDGSRNKRSVWFVATKPFPDAHFAVMPQALIEPCVLAGTSEQGACAACGAPFWRVVKKERTLDGEPATDLPPMRNTDKAAPDSAQGVGHWRTGTLTETLGWAPSCKCAGGGPESGRRSLRRPRPLHGRWDDRARSAPRWARLHRHRVEPRVRRHGRDADRGAARSGATLLMAR